MTFEIGSILLVKDYQLSTKVKDKFFIVIGHSEHETHLMSMTTSQIYFDVSLIKHGLIVDREMSVYCFEKGKVIGKNGFAFRKHTFVSHRNNIHGFSPEKINSLNVENIDCLIREELTDLIYSVYQKSPPKYMHVFENILSKITNFE